MEFKNCPTRNSLTNALELIEHDENGCDVCLGFDDEAPIADGPTQPTTESTTMEIDKSPVKKPSLKPTRTPAQPKPAPPKTSEQKTPTTTAADPQEVAVTAGLKPNRLALNRLQKEKGWTKGKAAVKLVEAFRPAPPAEEKPKTVVDRDVMPFAPKVIYLPLTTEGTVPSSRLSSEQHRRYVAIISNFLKAKASFRFDLNRFELQGFDEMLVNERKFYETECLKKVEATSNPSLYLHNMARKFYTERMQRRFACLPEKGFQCVDRTFDWLRDDPNASGRQCRPVVKSTINSGCLPKIQVPEPRRKCQLPNDVNLLREKLPPAGTNPIESDENAFNYLMDHELKTIMDACTLRTLLVMPRLYHDQTFAIKFSVRQNLHNDRLCRYVVFSKPVAASPLSRPTLQRQYLKWMLKSVIMKGKPVKIPRKRKLSNHEATSDSAKKERTDVDMEADAIPTTIVELEANDSTPGNLLGDTSTPSPEINESESKLDESFSSNDLLVIDEDAAVVEDDAPPEPPTSNNLLADLISKMGMDRVASQTNGKQSQPSTSAGLLDDQMDASTKKTRAKSGEPSDANDLLGGILAQMGDDDEEETECNNSALLQSKKKYVVVNFDTESENKLSLLVRSTSHGLMQNGEEVCLTVKSDYIPAIGAEKLDQEEILSNYFTALFKKAKTLLNVRIHPQTGNVLQIQHQDVLGMYASFTDDIRRMISQRSERLYQLLDKINDLNVGEYLLLHRGDKMELLSQTVEDELEPVWNADYLKSQWMKKPLLPVGTVSEVWQGVDIHMPLVWHIVQGRAPGSLPPKRHSGGFNPKEHTRPKPTRKKRRNNKGPSKPPQKPPRRDLDAPVYDNDAFVDRIY